MSSVTTPFTEKHATLRAGGKTDPTALAGAITHVVISEGEAKLSCIGPDAVNVAIKGIIIARSMLITQGKDLNVTPNFFEDPHPDPTKAGDKICGIRLHIKSIDA